MKETFADCEFANGGVPLNKGSEVGMFKLGSTVVLLFEVSRLYLHFLFPLLDINMLASPKIEAG